MGRSVRLYRSQPAGLKVGNFGDELTIPILERIFGVTARTVPMHQAELIAIGSILDSFWRIHPIRKKFLKLFASPRLDVWGSGFMLPDSRPEWPQELRLHLVRGQKTGAKLQRYKGPVGDPGLLSSLLLDNKYKKNTTPVVIVPHFVDEDVVNSLDFPPHWRVVHPDDETMNVIAAIAEAELVISSSLHGLIVADSFGIPAIWARSTNDLYKRSDFKFHDHASAREQKFNEPEPYVHLAQLPMERLNALSTIPKRNISSWQKEIIEAFPF